MSERNIQLIHYHREAQRLERTLAMGLPDAASLAVGAG